MSDREWMARALELAREREGFTAPNPPVGAVIVREGKVLGEGAHQAAGLPHAEVEAVRACSQPPRGATLYVTLEPCSTLGRTPACTDLIIREQIGRVVIGCTDPNPSHAGRGIEILRAAGVEVAISELEADCRRLIEPFARRITTGLPWITLKLALTLDGRIADRAHTSKWITGAPAREEVQRLRKRVDAILAGAETVQRDNPSLLCRLPGAPEKMVRVVLDARGALSPDLTVFSDAAAHRTIVATTSAAPAARVEAWKAAGARVWLFASSADGRIHLESLLRRLAADEGCNHILCEGGGHLAGSLLQEALVQEGYFFYAPFIFNDPAARSGFTASGWHLADAPRGHFETAERFGEDLLIRWRPDAQNSAD